MLEDELQGSINDGRKDNREKRCKISSYVQSVRRYEENIFNKSDFRTHIFVIAFYYVDVAELIVDQEPPVFTLRKKITHPV